MGYEGICIESRDSIGQSELAELFRGVGTLAVALMEERMEFPSDSDAVAQLEAEVGEVRPVMKVVGGDLASDLAGDLAGVVVATEDSGPPALPCSSASILIQEAVIIGEVRVP